MPGITPHGMRRLVDDGHHARLVHVNAVSEANGRDVGGGRRDPERLEVPEAGDTGAVLADPAVDADCAAWRGFADEPGRQYPAVGSINRDVTTAVLRGDIVRRIDRDDPSRVVTRGRSSA